MNFWAYYFALIALILGVALIVEAHHRNVSELARDTYYYSLTNECVRQGKELANIGGGYRCIKVERQQ